MGRNDTIGEGETLDGGAVRQPSPSMQPITVRRFRQGDEILGRYVVESELGQGGMGVVYRCLDKVGGVNVAVKGVPPDVAHNAGEMEEIRANFQLVCDLRHPNIAGVRTLEKDEYGDYYLVMDLAQGDDLGTWMRKNKDADLKMRLSIVRQIASALDYAHSRKVLHRDIKPGNIMVSPAGRVYILDFGLAAQISTSLSRTSHMVVSQSGTPAYKSPEQWRGKPQGAAADQYALAVVAYRLLSGKLPFDGDNVLILCRAVLEERPPVIKHLSSHANKALAKALAKDPHDRFPNCVAFADALEGKSATGGFWRMLGVALLSAGTMLAAGAVWLHFEKMEQANKYQSPSTNEVTVVGKPQDPSTNKVTVVDKPQSPSTSKVTVVDKPQSPPTNKVTVVDKPQSPPTNEVTVVDKPQPPSTNKVTVVDKPQDPSTNKVTVVGKPQSPLPPPIDVDFIKITNRLAVAIKERGKVYSSAEEFRNSPRGFAAKLKDIDEVWDAKTIPGSKLSKQEAENVFGAVSNEVGKLKDAVAWMSQNKGKRDVAVKKEADLEGLIGDTKTKDADLLGRAERNAEWAGVLKKVGDAKKLIDDGSFDEAGLMFDEAKKDIKRILNAVEAERKREFLKRLEQEGFVLDEERNTRPPGTPSVIKLPNGETIDMVWCPPGWFMMGSPLTEQARKPDEKRHPVRLTKGFWIGRYEITKGQWDAVMGGESALFGIGKRQPKDSVNWDDCQNFIRRLKTVAGINARLPTEAEWEYACRAGTTTPFSFGRQLNGTQAACNRAAPYGTSEKGPINLKWGVSDVGSFSAYANAWGINDMHGNVFEWCEDFFDVYPDPGDIAEDPKVEAAARLDAQTGRTVTLTTKVVRGGGWNYDPSQCRSACRHQCGAGLRGSIVEMTGFRLCCDDLP